MGAERGGKHGQVGQGLEEDDSAWGAEVLSLLEGTCRIRMLFPRTLADIFSRWYLHRIIDPIRQMHVNSHGTSDTFCCINIPKALWLIRQLLEVWRVVRRSVQLGIQTSRTQEILHIENHEGP
jgi:hypothetical protein